MDRVKPENWLHMEDQYGFRKTPPSYRENKCLVWFSGTLSQWLIRNPEHKQYIGDIYQAVGSPSRSIRSKLLSNNLIASYRYC